MYPSTEMLISVKIYIKTTQITVPVQKNFQSLSKKTYVPEQTYSSVVRLYSSVQ